MCCQPNISRGSFLLFLAVAIVMIYTEQFLSLNEPNLRFFITKSEMEQEWLREMGEQSSPCIESSLIANAMKIDNKVFINQFFSWFAGIIVPSTNTHARNFCYWAVFIIVILVFYSE